MIRSPREVPPEGGASGFDAGKKVKGRKRHLVVDTLGPLLAVTVTPAGVQERDAAPAVVAHACAKRPTLKRLYIDGAYAGPCAQTLHGAHGTQVDVMCHPGNPNAWIFHDAEPLAASQAAPTGVGVLPKRWVVERTHAWNERCRRLVMPHDRNPLIATAWVWFAQAHMLVSRLAV